LVPVYKGKGDPFVVKFVKLLEHTMKVVESRIPRQVKDDVLFGFIPVRVTVSE